MSLPIVGFAGMTHLGINTMAATAARGFPTLGYTPDSALAEQLRARRMPIVEPDLDRYIDENAGRIDFTATPSDLGRCDIVYIAADVPTDDDARSDLTPILALIDDVAAHLRQDALMVVLCQVPPGFTRAISAVPHPRLIYQVETLIFGRAIERAAFPERFIVGCHDPEAGLPAAYLRLLESFGCPILPMRYESAELAKISINFCLVASVCVANTLAEVSEAIGADWSEIAPALKLDRRIGQFAYLTPGLGISGGNLERDLRTVITIGTAEGTDVGVVESWIANSQYRKEWLWRTLRDHVLAIRPRPRITVLGLAYKENTHSTKNSPSLKLLEHLEGMEVTVHDPVVPASAVPWARGAATAAEACRDADVLVLATPWPEYRGIEVETLTDAMEGRTVIDPYRLLDGPALAARGFTWHTLGMPALHPRKD